MATVCSYLPDLLTLAAKRRRRVTAIVWRFLSVRPSVRLSVRRNPLLLNGKGRHRKSTHSRYTWHKGRVVMLSAAQWSSSVQLLQLTSLCLHGTYLNYMTDCHSVLCWSVVNTITV